MKPEDGPAAAIGECAYPAQPLGQALAVFVRRGHLQQPPRSATHQGDEQGEVVEDQNHE